MHCPWTRKARTWGYEVIRGIDEDDPLRVIRAFRYPAGLAFVDINSKVSRLPGLRRASAAEVLVSWW